MTMLKRIISFCLALVLTIGTVPPVAASASEMEETQPTVTEETVTVTEGTEAPVALVTEETEAPAEPVTQPETQAATEPVQTTESAAVPQETASQTEPEPVSTVVPEETEVLELTASAEVANAVLASGTCGDSLTWELSDEGVLTISGTGAMEEFSYDNPWHDYAASITKAVIEDGVTSIGGCAFYECTSLVSVSIPDSVVSIGMYAFRECNSLTSLVIPGSVTNIGSYVFESSALSSLTFCEGVTSIASNAIYYCGNLTSLTLPASITSVSARAFNGCTGLQEIHVNEANTSFCSVDGVLFNKDKTSLVRVPLARTGDYAVPEGVSTICEGAFNNSRLDSVTLPEGIITIEKESFYAGNMSSVNIPDTVVTIGDLAFEFCNLTEVTIPASVTTIGEEGFYYCHWLETVTFEGDAPSIGTDAFGDDTVTAYYPGDNATWTADKLQNYGGTITWIPYGQCGPDVEWVYDPVSKTLTLSGSGATYDYGGSGEPWEAYMSEMEHLVIEEGITYISPNGFRNLDSLKTMTHPGELETWDCITDLLDEAPFEKLTLTGTTVAAGQVAKGYMRGRNAPTVVLSEGITSIGEAAFMYCANVQNLVLPESLTTIGNGAFGEADGLTEVILPSSLTTLEDYAFFDNSSLTKITFRGDAPSIGAATFTNVVANVYYPQDNATWTASVKQNYGGTLTWASYDRPMTQTEFEALLSGSGKITLNKAVTLTEDLTIDLGSRIFTIGAEGMIIIPDGVKLTINSTTHIYGRLVQESGSWLETPTGSPAILNTFDDGVVYHANGASWSVSLNGRALHEDEAVDHISAGWVNSSPDGWCVTGSVGSSKVAAPGMQFNWVFYLNEWDADNYKMVSTPIDPDDLILGPYISITPLVEMTGPAKPGEPGDCFVYFELSSAVEAWDTESYVGYNYNGTELQFPVYIKRHDDMGFYNDVTASNDTWMISVPINPFADSNEFYFLITNEDWTVNDIWVDMGAEYVDMTQVSDKVYKLTVKPEVVADIYNMGGFGVTMRGQVINADGWNMNIGYGNIWCHPVHLNGDNDAYFLIDGTVYSYHAELDGYGYIDEDGQAVKQELPQGVSYDYASNTLTLDNAALSEFGVRYAWEDNTGYDLPSQELTVNLIGDNAVSSKFAMSGGVQVKLTGTGNITLGNTEIDSESLLIIRAGAAFDSGTVNQNGRIWIYEDVILRGSSTWNVANGVALNTNGSLTVQSGATLRFNRGNMQIHDGALTVEDGVSTNAGLGNIYLWLYDGSFLNDSVSGIDDSMLYARSNVGDFASLKQVIAAGETYGEASVSLTSSGFAIDEDYTIPANTTVIIEGYPDPITVEVPAGVTLTVDGTIRITNGELAYAGTVVNNGMVTVRDNGTVTELSGGVWEGSEPGSGGSDMTFATSQEELKNLIASGYSGPVQLQGNIVIAEDITLPDGYYLNIFEGSSLTIAGTLTIPNGNIHVYNNSTLTVQKGGKIVLGGNFSDIYAHGGKVDVQSGGKIVFEAEWSRMEVWNGATVTGLKKSNCILMYPVSNETQLRQAMAVSGYKQVVAVIEGDVTVNSSLTIPKGKTVSLGYWNMPTLTVASGATLTVKGHLEAYNMGHVLVESGAKLKNGGTFNISSNGRYTNYGTYIDDNCTYFIYHVFSGNELKTVLSLQGPPTEVYVHGDLTVDSALEIPEGVQVIMWGNLTVAEGGSLRNLGHLVMSQQESTLLVQEGGKLVNDGVVEMCGNELIIHRIDEYDLDNVVNRGQFHYDPENTYIDYCGIILSENAPEAMIYGKPAEIYAWVEGHPFTDAVSYWLDPESEAYATLTVKNGYATITPKYMTEAHDITYYVSAADGLDGIGNTLTIYPALEKLELRDNWKSEGGILVSGETLTYDLNRMNEDNLKMTLYEHFYPAEAQAVLQWSSSDVSVAIVDEYGQVVLNPDNTGTAVITAKDTVSGISASVTVQSIRRPAEIRISEECQGNLVGGSSRTYTVTAYDAEGNAIGPVSNSQIKWSVYAYSMEDGYYSIESPAYATIDAKGKLTTKAVNGQMDICVVARYADSGSDGWDAYCDVAILPAITALEVTGENLGADLSGMTIRRDLQKDAREYKLTFNMQPYELSVGEKGETGEWLDWKNYLQDWSWSSSNEDVAYVDQDGWLTILGAGKTKIKLTVHPLGGKNTTVSFTLVCDDYNPDVWVDTPNSEEPWLLESNVYLGEICSGQSMSFSNAKVSLVNAADKAYVSISKKGVVKAKYISNPVEVWLTVQSKDGYGFYENLSLWVLPEQEDVLLSTSRGYVTDTTQILAPGNTLDVYAENAGEVFWASDEPSVAAVDSGGRVTAIKKGTATITARATDGTGRKANFKVKVGKASEEVRITDKNGGEDFCVASGKSLNLVGTVTFSDGSTSKKAVKWGVFDEYGAPTDLAKISPSGKLTIAKGLRELASVTVCATPKDGSAETAFAYVEIYPIATGIDISGNLWSGIQNGAVQTVDIMEHSQIRMSANVYPKWETTWTSAYDTVTWKSSNNKVAKVDKDTGLVTLVKPGTVTITASSKDNSKVKASFKLQVIRKTQDIALNNKGISTADYGIDGIVIGGKSLTLKPVLYAYRDWDTGEGNILSTNQKVTWSLGTDGDGYAYATINSKGVLKTRKVTQKKMVEVIATAVDNPDCRCSFFIDIYPKAVSKVEILVGQEIAGKSLTLVTSDWVDLDANCLPGNGLNLAHVTWKSSNPKVVEVNENGEIYCLKPGKATITATAADGSKKKDTIKIVVQNG